MPLRHPRQNVAEPRIRLDPVQHAGLDQGSHDRPSIGATSPRKVPRVEFARQSLRPAAGTRGRRPCCRQGARWVLSLRCCCSMCCAHISDRTDTRAPEELNRQSCCHAKPSSRSYDSRMLNPIPKRPANVVQVLDGGRELGLRLLPADIPGLICARLQRVASRSARLVAGPSR